MSIHQYTFDNLLDAYNQGNEPLENWQTDDLIKLLDAIDRELQNRCPPQRQYDNEALASWYQDTVSGSEVYDEELDDNE